MISSPKNILRISFASFPWVTLIQIPLCHIKYWFKLIYSYCICKLLAIQPINFFCDLITYIHSCIYHSMVIFNHIFHIQNSRCSNLLELTTLNNPVFHCWKPLKHIECKLLILPIFSNSMDKSMHVEYNDILLLLSINCFSV